MAYINRRSPVTQTLMYPKRVENVQTIMIKKSLRHILVPGLVAQMMVSWETRSDPPHIETLHMPLPTSTHPKT